MKDLAGTSLVAGSAAVMGIEWAVPFAGSLNWLVWVMGAVGLVSGFIMANTKQ